jgi:hypothetical protein
MLNPDLFKSGDSGVGYRHRSQVTELAHRLEIVTEKYPESSPTRAFYIAALSSDPRDIEKGMQSEHEMVRFAAMTNVGFVPTLELLKTEPLAKYAFAYNQSTSSEVLDAIALTKKKNQNGVIRALVEIHPNKSQEVAALYALSPLGENDEYDDSSYDFFWEAMGYESEKIDLEAMKALTYLDLLNVIEVPGSNDSFWYEAILDNEPSGLKKLYEFAASMPQDASGFYEDLCVLRCWAAEFLTDKATLEAFSEDDFTVSSGIGGFYFADSRSPRSCVIMNEKVSPALVRKIYQDEIKNEDFDAYLNGVLWRLASSAFSPQDVTSGLVALIKDGTIKDEQTIENLLIGEQGDVPQGLYNNPSLSPETKGEVAEMIALRGLTVNY